MDLDSFAALLTPQGQQALQTAIDLQPREEHFLSHFQSLSRHYASGLARAALETAILRREAAAKFPFADRLYFTRESLEQSSAFPIAVYRAVRFRGFDRLFDLGCSIGGDSFALAAVAPLTALDLDPLRLALARTNLQALDLASQTCLVQADLLNPLPFRSLPGRQAGLFFDPARRTQGRRIHHVHNYQPPLETVLGWLEQFPAAGIKLSPGVDLVELAPYPAEVEFISLGGELKEAVLWFGPLRSASTRATLLPGGYTLAGPPAPALPLSTPLAYLYEPDPAVLRAGLVSSLGASLNACQLDPDIAYLTAAVFTPTPFARGWPLGDWFPFQLKRLRAYLRERGVGQLVVKKRGSALEPQDLIHSLRLQGTNQATIFLTQCDGQPIVLVAGTELPRFQPDV